jgi:hypothetical protein
MSARAALTIILPLALGACPATPQVNETTPIRTQPTLGPAGDARAVAREEATPHGDEGAVAPHRALAATPPILFQPGLQAHERLARAVRRSGREQILQTRKCFDLAPDPCEAMALVVGVDMMVDDSGLVTEAQPGDFEEWRRRWSSSNPYHFRAIADAPGVGRPSPSGLASYPDADRDFVRCVVRVLRSIRFELPAATPTLRLWFPYHVNGTC